MEAMILEFFFKNKGLYCTAEYLHQEVWRENDPNYDDHGKTDFELGWHEFQKVLRKLTKDGRIRSLYVQHHDGVLPIYIKDA